jgi:hypothetical protein
MFLVIFPSTLKVLRVYFRNRLSRLTS